MKAGYRKRAPKAQQLMDGGKAGGYSLSTLDRLDRATADEARMVERCALCPTWKFEGTAAECRGARFEHRRQHENGAPSPQTSGSAVAERRDRVLELRGAGRSLRAIAAELEVSVAQVRRDLGRCAAKAHLPETVTGRDGRQHPASRSPRSPVGEAA